MVRRSQPVVDVVSQATHKEKQMAGKRRAQGANSGRRRSPPGRRPFIPDRWAANSPAQHISRGRLGRARLEKLLIAPESNSPAQRTARRGDFATAAYTRQSIRVVLPARQRLRPGAPASSCLLQSGPPPRRAAEEAHGEEAPRGCREGAEQLFVPRLSSVPSVPLDWSKSHPWGCAWGSVRTETMKGRAGGADITLLVQSSDQ